MKPQLPIKPRPKAILLSIGTILGLYYFLFENSSGIRSSVWLPGLAGLLYALFSLAGRKNNPLLSPVREACFAFAFTLSLTLGFYFEEGRSLETLGPASFAVLLLRTVLITPAVVCLLRLVCSGIKSHSVAVLQRSTIRFRDWCTAFLLILALWFIVLLAYWPGFFNYDAWQVDEVLNHSYSTHHPLLHTLFLGLCYRFGVTIGRPDLGLILHLTIQSLILASILALAYAFLKSRLQSRALPILALLYYALFPANPVLAISTTKDVLFSGFILLALLLVLLGEDKEGRAQKRLTAALICTLTLILLFRKNAEYCILLTMAVFLFTMRRHPRSKSALAVCCIGFCLFKLCSFGLETLLQPTQGELAEALSLPIQQCGRVYEELKASDSDPETRRAIEDFFDMTQAYYRPERSDLMKFYAHISRENVRDFLKLSVRLLIRYPRRSLDAGLYLTKGAWSLWDASYAEAYRGLDRAGVLYTDIKPGYGIELSSKIPALERLFERLLTGNAYMDVPLLPLLFSPAAYIWLFLLQAVLAGASKDDRFRLLSAPFLFLLLTILAGPCILVRYVYPYMICMPVFLFMMLREAKEVSAKNDNLQTVY